MILLRLYLSFFKIGLLSVGGGLATLPFLYELSSTSGWFTSAQLADMVAISESTPGAMGVNMATYAGFTTSGVLGAIVATLGLVTPSILIILLIVKYVGDFKSNKHVQAIFRGVRPVSMGLISMAGITMFKMSILDIPTFSTTGQLLDLFQMKAIVLAVVLSLLLWKKKLHPIAIVAIAGVCGVVFSMGV